MSHKIQNRPGHSDTVGLKGSEMDIKQAQQWPPKSVKEAV